MNEWKNAKTLKIINTIMKVVQKKYMHLLKIKKLCLFW